MTNNKANYPAMIQIINIIHGALIVFPVAFAGVTVYINETAPMASENMSFLSYVAIGVLIIAFPLSSILFKSTIRNSSVGQKELSQKIAAYQTAHLIRMAAFEGCGFIAGIAVLQTGNYYNLGVLAVVLAMFIVHRPTPTKIAIDLELNMDEKNQLMGATP
ncbi:MAG: hypothetical protein ABJH05_14005 [Fulvivirga sp.]